MIDVAGFAIAAQPTIVTVSVLNTVVLGVGATILATVVLRLGRSTDNHIYLLRCVLLFLLQLPLLPLPLLHAVTKHHCTSSSSPCFSATETQTIGSDDPKGKSSPNLGAVTDLTCQEGLVYDIAIYRGLNTNHSGFYLEDLVWKSRAVCF